MTHVKICGFQTPELASVAAEAGVDAVGLVFVPSARRCITAEQAEAIIAALRPAGVGEVVGMFADQPADDVNALVDRLKLDAVQLCGAEGMGYCKEINVPIYKVVSVDPAIPISAQLPRLMVQLQRHAMAGHRPVLDTKVGGEFGGTGQRFDWALAADLAQAFELTLAGGLTPDNVAEAIKIVRPWGVDTSSGVETDGEKDAVKIREFVKAVREQDEALRGGIWRRLFSGAGGRT